MKGRTSIVVAPGLSTVRSLDRILVFDRRRDRRRKAPRAPPRERAASIAACSSARRRSSPRYRRRNRRGRPPPTGHRGRHYRCKLSFVGCAKSPRGALAGRKRLAGRFCERGRPLMPCSDGVAISAPKYRRRDILFPRIFPRAACGAIEVEESGAEARNGNLATTVLGACNP